VILKFLADENIFPKVISYLRNLGFDVKSVREIGLSQITDDKIIDIATKEKRSIITFDKHFGDILRYRPQDLPGIILIRIHPPILDDIFYALDNLFKKYSADSFNGKLIVLSKSGYRIR
jgi:predicted nuclease of predicted toxin-antitoxin system